MAYIIRRLATDETGPGRLTPRERQILRFLVAGKTNRQIAVSLERRGGDGPLSDETVGKHVSSILRKLGCASRTQAATYAVLNGLE
jgi:DNA-binding NarL/FixJ family response regulator